MAQYLNYKKNINGETGWAVEEVNFKQEHLNKFEVIQSLGNGYLGLRACPEENYSTRHYGLFIGGTFNTPAGVEVPELPNGADIINVTFYVNGEMFDLTKGTCEKYTRYLDIKQAILTREFDGISPNQESLHFKFETFVSSHSIHMIAQRITVKANNADIKLMIQSGIDGQTTNSGTQHFIDYDARFYQAKVLQYIFQADPIGIDFFYNRTYRYSIDGVAPTNLEFNVLSVYGYDRRKLYNEIEFFIKQGQTFVMESTATVHTSRDFDFTNNLKYEQLLKKYGDEVSKFSQQGYEVLKKAHVKSYQQKMNSFGIDVQTSSIEETVKIRLATYHLIKFTPGYDSRLNIDAKGGVGEEYKGHTFWDTEIYILPYYVYTDPEKARKLLEHRYFVMPSAFIKAKDNNMDGAMGPWETCGSEDGETCPTGGEVDFKTGKRIKVGAAYNELHISADIMGAIGLYYQQTHDDDFMEKYGYEMLLETSRFGISKIEHGKDGKLVINNVTGPNEYKENVNNNAFTNYMVKHGFDLTTACGAKIISNNQLKTKFKNFEVLVERISQVKAKLYLPQPQDDLLINENDAYLSLPEIPNFKSYKESKGSIGLKYTSNELNQYQVNKQADIVCLFYTLPQLFNHDVIMKNGTYYEEHTLHGSSLSLSMHATTANMVGATDLGYRYFQESLFEFNDNMSNCVNGLHAAGIGGILKCIIEGFGGISNNTLFIINPMLPASGKRLSFACYIFKNKCQISITPTNIKINVIAFVEPCKFYIQQKSYQINALNQSIEVKR